ncbi:MAG: UDP-N-acetylmuramate:L-alanyl-gamma-D-glutamyl-meso-diaminopimelate ligase [bacterium]
MTASNARPFPELPTDIHKIHVIGICGTGMGSLAAMLKARGFDVRGSDAMAYPPMSDWLRDQGIDIMVGYDAHNLDWNPDLVVVGNVVRKDYADAVAMRERGFPYLSFPEALRHFFMKDSTNLVITGTHGKTTTTSMVAWCLTQAGLDPSFMVGGITGNFDSNYRLSDSKIFVVEGDEYDTAYFDKVPKFWHYAPFRATINNLEYDHADIYPDIAAVEHVFERMVALIPPEGSLWVNGDDTRALKVSSHAACERRLFGLEAHNNLRAINIEYDEVSSAEVLLDGETLGRFRIPAMGEFNIRNMLGALAICLDEGADLEKLRGAFAGFIPTRKRQELVGTVNDIRVFDDFAHHPTAVEATMRAMRDRFGERKIWALFEAKSNTSRRRVFQFDYPRGLAIADHVIISKPWRKDEGLADNELLDIDELVRDTEALGPPTLLIEDVDDIADYVASHAKPGDVIVGLSGSNFGGLHRKILDRLHARFPA